MEFKVHLNKTKCGSLTLLLSQLLLSLITFPVLAFGSNGIWLQNELQHPCNQEEQLNVTTTMDNHNCARRGPRGWSFYSLDRLR